MTGCKLTRTSLPHPPPLPTPCPKLNPCSTVHAADSRPIAAVMGVPTARSMHHSAVRSIARTGSSHTWGGGVMTSFLLESPDKHYHQTKPAIPDNDKAVTPFRRTNSFSLALVHTFRRHERGRAGACATRAGRKLIAQGGDPHMTARPQPGFNFILFTSHVPFLALPDGRVPAAAHTNSIQGWFPAGLPVTVTPWPAGAGLLSIGDRTIRLTRPRSAVPLFSSKLSKRFAAVALLTPEVLRLVAVLSPLLHSPLEPALLTQFAGAGVSLATSGPIPRSVNCAHVPSNVYKFFPQLSPGLTFRDCASLRHLRVPVKLGWPRPGPPSGRGGG